MNQETLSSKLNRIKDATNSIREIVGVQTDAVIEDVALATNSKITELNTEITTKAEALNAKTLELEETIRNKEADIAAAVTEATAAKDIIIEEKNATIKEIGKFRRYDSRAAILAETEPVEGNQAVALKVTDLFASETPVIKKITFKQRLDIPEGKTQADIRALWTDMQSTYFRGETEDETITFSIRTEGNYIRVSYYDNFIQVDGRYTVSATSTSKKIAAGSTFRIYDMVSGTSTTLAAGETYDYAFPVPLTRVSDSIPEIITKMLVSGVDIAFEGALEYKESTWQDLDLGEETTESIIPVGTKFLTSQGLKEGSLGTFGEDAAQGKYLTNLLAKASESPIKIAGGTAETSPITATLGALPDIGSGMNPMLKLIDYTGVSGQALLRNVNTGDYVDFSEIKPELLPQFTSLKGAFITSSPKTIDFSALDTSKVQSLHEAVAFNWNQETGDKAAFYESIQESISKCKWDSLTTVNAIYRYATLNRLYVHDTDFPMLTDVGAILKWASCSELFVENCNFSKPLMLGTDAVLPNDIKEIVFKNSHITFDDSPYYTDYVEDNGKIRNFNLFLSSAGDNVLLETIILHTDNFVNFRCSDYGDKLSYLVTSTLDEALNFRSGGSGKIYVNDELFDQYYTSEQYTDVKSKLCKISELPQNLIEKYGFEEIVAAYKNATTE